MKKLAFAAVLAVSAGTAFAQYYPAPPAPYYGGGYYQPRYRTVCHQEPRQVCDYYGYCRTVYQRVCRQVSY